jgi:hypothetical protein
MTRLVPDEATATNSPFPYVTEVQPLAGGAVTVEVQVSPSGDVITRFAPPEFATATNLPFP